MRIGCRVALYTIVVKQLILELIVKCFPSIFAKSKHTLISRNSFNSTYLMLERVEKLKPAIVGALYNSPDVKIVS